MREGYVPCTHSLTVMPLLVFINCWMLWRIKETFCLCHRRLEDERFLGGAVQLIYAWTMVPEGTG